MPNDRQLTISLPEDIAESVHDLVASGQFPSESDVIESALREASHASEIHDPELEDWLRTVGVARYDAYDANPGDVLTMSELKTALTERRAMRSKAE